MPDTYKIVNAWETEPSQGRPTPTSLLEQIGRWLKEQFGGFWDTVGKGVEWLSGFTRPLMQGLVTLAGTLAEGARRFGTWILRVGKGILGIPKALYDYVGDPGKWKENTENTFAAFGVDVKNLREDVDTVGEDIQNGAEIVKGIFKVADKATFGLLALDEWGELVGNAIKGVGEYAEGVERYFTGTNGWLMRLNARERAELEQKQAIMSTDIYSTLDEALSFGMYAQGFDYRAIPDADTSSGKKTWYRMRWAKQIGEGTPRGLAQVTHGGEKRPSVDIVLNKKGVWDLSLMVTLQTPGDPLVKRVDGSVHIFVYAPNSHNKQNGQHEYYDDLYLHRVIHTTLYEEYLSTAKRRGTILASLMIPVPAAGYRVHVCVEGFGVIGASQYTTLTLRHTDLALLRGKKSEAASSKSTAAYVAAAARKSEQDAREEVGQQMGTLFHENKTYRDARAASEAAHETARGKLQQALSETESKRKEVNKWNPKKLPARQLKNGQA